MDADWLLALAVLFCLLAAAGLARRFVAPGWRKNALSVVLVVLGLLTAFAVSFAAGALMRGFQPTSKLHGSALPNPGRLLLAQASSAPSGKSKTSNNQRLGVDRQLPGVLR